MLLNSTHILELFQKTGETSLGLAYQAPENANNISIDGASLKVQHQLKYADILADIQQKKETLYNVVLSESLLFKAKKAMPKLFLPNDFYLPLAKVCDLYKTLQNINQRDACKRRLLMNCDISRTMVSKKNASFSNEPCPKLLASRGDVLTARLLHALTKTRKEISFSAMPRLALRFDETGFLIYKEKGSDEYLLFQNTLWALRKFAENNIPFYITQTIQGFLTTAHRKNPRIFIIPYINYSSQAKKLFYSLKKQNPTAICFHLEKTVFKSNLQLYQKLKNSYTNPYPELGNTYNNSATNIQQYTLRT